MIVLICHQCQRPSTIDARFCSACGTELRRRECPTCRALNDPESKHCHACGASLASADAAASTQAAASATATAARTAAPRATGTKPAAKAVRRDTPPREERSATRTRKRDAGRSELRGGGVKPAKRAAAALRSIDLDLRPFASDAPPEGATVQEQTPPQPGGEHEPSVPVGWVADMQAPDRALPAAGAASTDEAQASHVPLEPETASPVAAHATARPAVDLELDLPQAAMEPSAAPPACTAEPAAPATTAAPTAAPAPGAAPVRSPVMPLQALAERADIHFLPVAAAAEPRADEGPVPVHAEAIELARSVESAPWLPNREAASHQAQGASAAGSEVTRQPFGGAAALSAGVAPEVVMLPPMARPPRRLKPILLGVGSIGVVAVAAAIAFVRWPTAAAPAKPAPPGGAPPMMTTPSTAPVLPTEPPAAGPKGAADAAADAAAEAAARLLATPSGRPPAAAVPRKGAAQPGASAAAR